MDEPEIQAPTTALEPNFLQAMLKQFTSLSKDVLIYGLSGSLAQVFSLITIPILTRLLTVGEFGTVDVINATIGYFAILMGFNIGSGLWRYYYEVPETDLKNRQRMVSSLLWFVLGLGAPITLVISALAEDISVRLFDKPDFALAIQLAVLALPLMAVYNLFIGLQRLKRRPLTFLSINLGYSLLYFVLVLVFIVGFKLNIQGIFLAQLIAYSCAGLVAIWLGRDLLVFTFSKEWFYKMASYGLPMLPAAFLNWTLVAINRYYLNAFVGIDQVGYYSLAAKVSLAMALVVSSFTLAWQPFMLANLKDPNSPRLYTLTLNYYLMVTLLIAACLAVFAREIVLILGTAAYLPSVGLVSILAIRQILPGMDYITSVGVVIAKKTIFYSISLGVGVLVNLLGNLLLTKRLGIYGAAISEMCGVLSVSIVIFIISNRLFPVKWNLRVVLLNAAGYAAVVLLSFALFRVDLAHAWLFLVKIALLVVYAVYLLWVIGPEERKLILGFFKSLLSMLSRLRFSSKPET